MKNEASKRKIIILVGVVFALIIGVLINVNIPKQDLSKETDQSTNSGKTLAVYIEEDGGEYRASSSGDFPTDGYILDTEKSTCENGGELSQDPETKTISLSVDHKTKCSLYFKKEPIKPVKGSLAEKLINQANDESITDYDSGVKGEMFTFEHPATVQTDALTDYRYIGNEPNNYIQFNNETWRIIGVFTVEGENGEKEQRIKIIRDESIGNFPWDLKADKSYKNEWTSSSLAIMLNGDYLNSDGNFTYTWYSLSRNGIFSSIQELNGTIVGLNATAKSQISPAKWYLGALDGVERSAGTTWYIRERGTEVYTGRSTNWIANVGLMYSSDYLYTYANGVDNTCFEDTIICYTTTPTSGWLFNSSDQWTITHSRDSSNIALIIGDSGSVSRPANSDFYVYNSINMDTRPSLYLKSDIQIVSGTGAENDPYILNPTQYS